MKKYDLSQEHEARPSRNPEPGYIYLVECEGQYKIGKTKNIPNRMSSLRASVPFKITLVHSIYVSDMARAERLMHYLHTHRHNTGEWFALTPQDVARFRRITTERIVQLWEREDQGGADGQ